MRRFGLIAGLAASMIASAAFAADLPVKAIAPAPMPIPVASWTGFYAGLNAGGGWGSENETIAGTNTNAQNLLATGLLPSQLNTRGGGVVLGGQVGYNWQYNARFVFGGEADGAWSNIKGSDQQTVSLLGASVAGVANTKLDWLSTVRGRVGYLVLPQLMVYGTGGVAFGGVTNTNTASVSAPGLNVVASNDGSTTKTGWVAGAGVEYRIPNTALSVKTEYNYVDLGEVDTPISATVFRQAFNFESRQALRYHIVRAGLNYHF